MRARREICTAILLLGLIGPLPAPTRAADAPSASAATPDPASQLLPVDCLLPGRIRKLGRQLTYVAPRQALKTTALDCEIRGGEYTAYDRADYRTALAVWKPQADGGDARAQNYVGEIYERGLGIAPDYAEAARWYRKAAEQGYGPAQINLGELLERGLGVPQDEAAALTWYRRASGLAQVNLPYVAVVEKPAPPPPDTKAREVETLRAELERTRAELERTQAEASAREADAASRAQTASAREQAAREREEDAKAREAAEAAARAEQQRAADAAGRSLEASRAEIAQRAETVNAREAAVLAKERDLEEKRQQLQRLQAETEAQQKQAAEAEAQRSQAAAPPPAEVEVPGPTIVLIDPQVPASRGTPSVRTASTSGERPIVGRVEAPGGLVLLSVNDVETAAAENGIFQTRVKLEKAETPVSIVAVDRQGKRGERQITLLVNEPAGHAGAGATPAAEAPPKPKLPPIDFGSYHALVIGNDQYQRLPRLETAVADAKAMAEVLSRRYGFQVTTLLNANRYQILSALNQLRAELTEKDNLLIYYAGHGELDQTNMRGHWLPVDAEPDSTANWISNTSLTDLLNAMAAKHILVIADSCYSGSLTRSSLARLERGMTEAARIAWQTQMAKGRSRTALTSGGLEPVLDGGGGGHSVFAKALLNVLERNEDVLEGQRLFSEISALVTWAAEAQRFDQLPQYAPIKYGGHESGDFFFVPRA